MEVEKQTSLSLFGLSFSLLLEMPIDAKQVDFC